MSARPAGCVLTIVGFDSAWTDSPKAPGAVCIIRADGSRAEMALEPTLASFAEALQLIATEKDRAAVCLVALDQPTIVPNVTGARPVDRVAGSVISWMGGGVQPANRSRRGMFDDAAPIWRFKELLGAEEDPERSRVARSGLYLIEVFPALALATIDERFCARKGAPHYNPSRRRSFSLSHWTRVLEAVARAAAAERIAGLAEWCRGAAGLPQPRKPDQDKLDAAICALVGYQWRAAPRSRSVMVGDLATGYMIAPAGGAARERLVAAARLRGVPVDGAVPV